MYIVSTFNNSSKKKKKKWASAEQKRNALELERNWEELKKRHASTTTIKKPVVVKTPVATNKTIEDNRPKSLNSWITGPVSSKPNQKYTGDNVKGIVVQHKSCLQPVFNQQEAIDSAKMRRG